ncbi:MAG: hypothetical protein A2277_20900 [Desulfobacterales bacterium RIFOXYA12_FULL_46_15]|nr:MAG: hypothetical protein A2097_12930 [Desulfobacula sp. GWF2_41_7]OGR26357.1 MAG: hypothetical protein A2277_20900 [Desulfobacterales bacterium RIFOXYA12_FULL_46_15]
MGDPNTMNKSRSFITIAIIVPGDQSEAIYSFLLGFLIIFKNSKNLTLTTRVVKKNEILKSRP